MVEFGMLINAQDLYAMVFRSNPGIFPPDGRLKGWTANLKSGRLTIHIETKEDLGGVAIPVGYKGEELKVFGKADKEDAMEFRANTEASIGKRIEAIEVDPTTLVTLLKKRVQAYPHDAIYKTTQVYRPNGDDGYCYLFRIVATTHDNTVADLLRDPNNPERLRDFMPRSIEKYDASDIHMIGLKNKIN